MEMPETLQLPSEAAMIWLLVTSRAPSMYTRIVAPGVVEVPRILVAPSTIGPVTAKPVLVVVVVTVTGAEAGLASLFVAVAIAVRVLPTGIVPAETGKVQTPFELTVVVPSKTGVEDPAEV